MVFFKRGEIVTISGGAQRWCVEAVNEGYDAAGESVSVATLSDEDRKVTRLVPVDKLTKVAG